MGNILLRIQKIASHEGITIGALERKIGASKGVLSRAINNGTDIQSKWVQIIVENYPQYSADWLLTGRGEMLSSEASAPPPTAQNPAQHDALVGRLLDTVKEQAEEIGRLKAQIDELERRRGDDASDAASSKSALVG